LPFSYPSLSFPFSPPSLFTVGARPLNRAIQTELLNPLSQFILNDQVRDGEEARVEFDEKANRLAVLPNHEPSVPMDEDSDYDDAGSEIEIEEVDE
jgi:ATP-dependent Clp protease ATP-binding subunit ClpB